MHHAEIQVLASAFDKELQTHLEVVPLRHGAMLYRKLLVKRTSTGKWGLFNTSTKELIAQYFLKRCTLLAANLYTNGELNCFTEIALLDTKYWWNHCDSMLFRHNISQISTTSDRFLIALTRLEYSTEQAQFYKKIIFKRFNYAFG